MLIRDAMETTEFINRGWFCRLIEGVALFIDQVQIERTLDVSERIAARAIADDKPESSVQRYELESNPRVKPRKIMKVSRKMGTCNKEGGSDWSSLMRRLPRWPVARLRWLPGSVLRKAASSRREKNLFRLIDSTDSCARIFD